MWEAFGKSSDRDILTLNLDNYKIADLGGIHERDLHFIVYNPETERRTFDITFAPLIRGGRAWIGDTRGARNREIEIVNGTITMSLDTDQPLYLTITR